jgi:hypothetical protein
LGAGFLTGLLATAGFALAFAFGFAFTGGFLLALASFGLSFGFAAGAFFFDAACLRGAGAFFDGTLRARLALLAGMIALLIACRSLRPDFVLRAQNLEPKMAAK